MQIKNSSFLLILAASFLMILIYVTNPALNRIGRDFGLGKFNHDYSILLGGDVMLGRSVMTTSFGKKNYSYPFEKIKEETKKADVFLVNLENPILKNCPFTNEGLIFCARPEMVEGLVAAGVDIVNLANNHAGNYGREGLAETKETLKKAGIETIGMGNLVVKEQRGIKYGFLGFDFLSKAPTKADYELVEDSKKNVDFLILSVHWGVEYKINANQYQRQWARELVSAGADIIAGHHPHVIQESEELDASVVYYSLGNLVFDQMERGSTREGLLAQFLFRDGALVGKEEIKTFMESFAQPIFLGQ